MNAADGGRSKPHRPAGILKQQVLAQVERRRDRTVALVERRFGTVDRRSIASCRKSLELDPENDNARKMLEELESGE